MTSQNGEEYLTLEEAAALLGVSSRTVLRYVKERKIRRYTRGLVRGYFYRRSELQKLIEMKPEDNDQHQ